MASQTLGGPKPGVPTPTTLISFCLSYSNSDQHQIQQQETVLHLRAQL